MERTTTRLSILTAVLLCLAAAVTPGPTLACDDEPTHVIVVSATDATPAPEAPAQPARPPRTPRAPRAATVAPGTPSPAPASAPEPPEAAPDAPPPPSLVTPRGWFGFGFQCGDCSAQSVSRDSAAVWWFGDMPRVYSVDLGSPAFRAGLRRGDVISGIDGVSIVTPEGGRRFGLIRPGQVVRWTVVRDGEERQVVARAAERPDRRERTALLDLQRELGRLNEIKDMELLRREIAELNREMARSKVRDETRSIQIRTLSARPLRYAGVIGGAEVEVRGPGSVIVNEIDNKNELVINIGESVVRIRVPETMPKQKGDTPK